MRIAVCPVPAPGAGTEKRRDPSVTGRPRVGTTRRGVRGGFGREPPLGQRPAHGLEPPCLLSPARLKDCRRAAPVLRICRRCNTLLA